MRTILYSLLPTKHPLHGKACQGLQSTQFLRRRLNLVNLWHQKLDCYFGLRWHYLSSIFCGKKAPFWRGEIFNLDMYQSVELSRSTSFTYNKSTWLMQKKRFTSFQDFGWTSILCQKSSPGLLAVGFFSSSEPVGCSSTSSTLKWWKLIIMHQFTKIDPLFGFSRLPGRHTTKN